jgi:hypothetical protein
MTKIPLGALLIGHVVTLCFLGALACSRAGLPVLQTTDAEVGPAADASTTPGDASIDPDSSTIDAATQEDASTPPWEIDAGYDPDAACEGRVLEGGACLVTLAVNQAKPWGIAIDTQSVYWVNQGSSFNDGSVMKLARSGGTPVTLASGLREPQDIAVDGVDVYWSGSSVAAVPRNGGATRTIFDDSNSTTSFVTRSGAKVYWADSEFNFGVQSAMPDGSAITWLTSPITMIGGLAPSRTGIVYTVATDQVNIPGKIVSVTFGGISTELLTTPGSLGFVRSAYDTIVYVDDTRAMYWLPLQGGTPTFLANGIYPNDVITDGTSVYWTDGNLRAVMKLDIATGAPVVLVSQHDEPRIFGSGALTIDAHSVFFTDANLGGSVFKLTPR